MQYSVSKFLAALTLGRIVRYSILAYLAGRYGRHMLTFITQVRHPILIVVIALMAIGFVVFVIILGTKRKKSASA
jgi:membrane protein DedA with SNARE-associated domain